MFCKKASGEGNRRGARQLSVGALCFCCRLILFFSWCRPFQRIWAGAKRGYVSFFLNPRPPFYFLHFFYFNSVLPIAERPCLEVFQPENKSKWHVTRTQCLGGPAKVSGPICCGWFLFCGLSATSGERGQGPRAVLRQWHLPGATAGMAGRPQSAPCSLAAAAHCLPAFAQAQVIHHSSGFRCLVTFPWCTHIQRRTKVSACNERFDSWRATEAEVMELLQIRSWLMLMGEFWDGGHN